MNKILPIIICLLSTFNLQAQSTTTALKEKGLIKGQTIYLNSKARIGGKSRVTIPIQLPPNTVSWSYSFSTIKTNDASTKLAGSGLEMQIAKLIADGAMSLIKAGVVTNVVGQLVKPTGSGVVDIYLTDANGLKQFEEKDLVGMYSNDVPTFYREGTAENSRNGIFQIPVVRKDLFLCLKNPSVTEGLAVSIDVVAIVSVKEYRDVWTASGLESVHKDCLGTFSMRDEVAEKVCDCTKGKVKSAFTPAHYQRLTQNEQENLIRSYRDVCMDEQGFADESHKQGRIVEIKKLVRGQGITKDYKGAVLSYLDLLHLGEQSWDLYDELVYSQLCIGQFEEAKKYLTIALGKYPENLNLMGNLANYYLLKGDTKQAMAIYKKYKGKKLENKQRFKDAASLRLMEFERLGYGNVHFTEVRQELNGD